MTAPAMTGGRAAVLAVAATGALAGWVALAGAHDPGVTRDAVLARVALLVGAAAAYVAGRASGRFGAVAAALIAAGTLVALATGSHALSGRPLAGPLGYGNADGALYAQAATACGLLAVRGARPSVRARWLTTVAWLGLAAFTAAAALTTSVAGAIGAVAVALTALAVNRYAPRPRTVAAVAGVLLVALALVTAAAGALHRRGHADPVAVHAVASALTERRVNLWHDAVVLAGRHPAFGVGPGRFPVESPTARSDNDTRWAHSQPLETAAETGVAGAVLLALAVAGVLTDAGRRRTASRAAPVAIVGFAAFVAQSEIDYVAHFPAVVLVAAAIAGIGRGLPDRTFPISR